MGCCTFHKSLRSGRNVGDYLNEGQEVEVVVLDVDQRGLIKLSIKELENYRDQNEPELTADRAIKKAA